MIPERSAITGVLRIGSLRVDPALDEIVRDGRVIKLEPRAMRLLLCLAAHAGEVVSVDYLLKEVWPDVVVTPDSVYQAVANLRRMLGDDPKQPIFIANVVRRGYRLLPAVEAWVDPPAPPLLTTPATPSRAVAPSRTFPPSARIRRYFPAALVAIIVALGIVVALQFWHRPRHKPATASAVVVQDSSVAVLPFQDLSESKDEEFFADGLTEEIIDLLANVPALRVPARTSSFYFKGKTTSVQHIAKALGVAHVLEGSVRRSGDTLRITATLSRADNGYQLWSQTYELGKTDVFAIQDDIAAAVVRNLQAIILAPKLRTAAPPANFDAYIAVLRARFLLNHETDSDNRQAIAALQRAVALDPTFAVAWAELARAHRDRASYFDEIPDADMNLARSQAEKALALDPKCAEAHEVLADIKLIFDFDPAGSIRESDAIEAADPSARVHDAYAFYSGCVVGPCYEQVIRATDEEIANDPLNPSPYSTQALARYVFGDLARAERDVRHAIALSPTSGYRHYLWVRILLSRQDRAQLSEVTKILPDSLYNRASLALAFHALGRAAEADAALQQLLTQDSKAGPYQIAEVYAARGQFDEAMTWLERAYALRDSGLWTLQVDPLLRPLADNPRFGDLKRKLHMQA